MDLFHDVLDQFAHLAAADQPVRLFRVEVGLEQYAHRTHLLLIDARGGSAFSLCPITGARAGAGEGALTAVRPTGTS
ncbi:hypothetical protein GCM10010383_48830 [Streptomyces lomondensis]|uniref:Uncharacterized protein n=1 Tax=Streptomyces lomondensis TaxID=68229 RepID=A0ABQ2XEL8_9ACTN|nr:hypothetical protein GCM10010383_48830 [Streptomyces lomondensis]